jgi:hypothetical protein
MGQVASEIARQASVRPHVVGRAELIARDDVPRFLDACERAKGVVVGIEGFRIMGDRIEPDMSSIADFSELTDSARSIVEARRFVESSNPDLAFDFTIHSTRDASHALDHR